VWYTKKLMDGESLMQTTVEPGPGVKGNHAHLYGSNDNREWYELVRFKKDRWPMRVFKFGTFSFADGRQSLEDFVLSGEGLIGFDGKAVLASAKF
jgi:hypothetical protein